MRIAYGASPDWARRGPHCHLGQDGREQVSPDQILPFPITAQTRPIAARNVCWHATPYIVCVPPPWCAYMRRGQTKYTGTWISNPQDSAQRAGLKNATIPALPQATLPRVKLTRVSDNLRPIPWLHDRQNHPSALPCARKCLADETTGRLTLNNFSGAIAAGGCHTGPMHRKKPTTCVRAKGIGGSLTRTAKALDPGLTVGTLTTGYNCLGKHPSGLSGRPHRVAPQLGPTSSKPLHELICAISQSPKAKPVQTFPHKQLQGPHARGSMTSFIKVHHNSPL
jgi:hypothetical protein